MSNRFFGVERIKKELAAVEPVLSEPTNPGLIIQFKALEWVS
jgi:hypothetical protein